jgi:uncharacterized protein YigE (DUF2233 family)
MFRSASVAGSRVRRVCLCGLLSWALSYGVLAAEFSEAKIAGKRVTVCRVDVAKERIDVFLRDDSGQPFKSFEALERHLIPRGQRLMFALNAGMYQRDFSPVGLLVAEGRELSPLNTNSGYGNFFMKPNGVFVISETGPRVVETSEYPKLKGRVRLATQSGPLLVRAGRVIRCSIRIRTRG